MPPMSRAPLHVAPSTLVVGSASHEKFYRGKNRPACPRTVLGLAQQRVVLMCGPGRGLLSVYKKRGTLLYPFTCARAVGAAPMVTPSRRGEVSQGKTEAQDNQSNAKAETTRSRGTNQAPPARPLPGQLAPHQQSEPPLSPRSPTSRWARAREACPWWHADLCEDKEHSRSDED